ncbi:hypothetical protein [Gelidibacter maritimus]|uniref:Uncharacterized protein n=1 Tax=Gelidibacter maritimus TaxID=2761487 RepID=A0A7W2M3Z4_9FLAO|nr:hypothetical protein [Gelidibacter maritimus]MBA6152222.1 hypothetical protein [Gelidibacter maritimus]
MSQDKLCKKTKIPTYCYIGISTFVGLLGFPKYRDKLLAQVGNPVKQKSRHIAISGFQLFVGLLGLPEISG